jgi:hypothetical protein
MARDLTEIASHISQLKGDANAYLRNRTTTNSGSASKLLTLR